mmetsp:Transcript_10863/g.16756  ORF Transcript_10863/g.16756 Transcript_10863/m.16756 type:complete len:319 (-) Transcript_10863:182-1138(-)
MLTSPSPAQLSELTIFANELADTAREAILPYWRQSEATQKIEHKFDADRSACQVESPVTAADRAAEKIMRALIEARYPSHGIYGEEFGTVRTDAEYLWVLDPIDGTKSFITGKPLFGTLIACLHKGVPVIGIMDQCVLKERWVGVKGEQTTFNGEPVKTATNSSELATSMLMATTPDMFAPGFEADRFKKIAGACRHPNYGTDCYAYALVASGFGAHIVVEADLGLYDYCALVPVVEGAGGIMTDWTGEKLTLQNHELSKGRVVACANSDLHKEALQILNKPSSILPCPVKMTQQLLNLQTISALGAGILIGMLFSKK